VTVIAVEMHSPFAGRAHPSWYSRQAVGPNRIVERLPTKRRGAIADRLVRGLPGQ
jgi:hypothetical protein